MRNDDLSSEELMRLLGISRATLTRIVHDGRAHRQNPQHRERLGYEGMPMPYQRGRNLFWPRDAIERWIATAPVVP